jgi:hypothetical protein
VQDISIQAEDEKHYKIFDSKQKGRDQLGDLSTEEKIKMDLKEKIGCRM